jgi:hypothetical protein
MSIAVSFGKGQSEVCAGRPERRLFADAKRFQQMEKNLPEPDMNHALPFDSCQRIRPSEALDGIVLLAGSEAYQSSLAFYSYIKLLASQDVPRAKAICEELKKRFPGCKKSSKNGDVDNGAV